MSKKQSFNDRVKKMKESIENSKHILNSDFPDNVTISGNTDLIKNPDNECKEDEACQKDKK
ncbi:MAG: hypothetical protein JKY50_13780 [Oleispira sp.]|nr:hypothetical protein [Oleispira sp.]